MKYYIYLTTNIINNKKYIGQHKGKPDDNYFGSGTAILKAIKKYGKHNFTKQILCYCSTREEANQKEKEYIKFYNAVEDPNFYNLAEGGEADGWKACQRYLSAHPQEAKELYKKNRERLEKWAKEHPQEYQEKVVKPFLEGSKRWRENNPDKVKEHMKIVNQKKEEWQLEHFEEYQKQVENWRKKGSEANSQKVKCLTTGEIFPSQSEAARHYNIAQANISKCLKGERKSAGVHPKTKEKLIWERI